METLVTELAKLALNAARRGDMVESRQLVELAALAQTARVQRMDALLTFFERIERLIDQGAATGPDQAQATEQGV